MPKFKPGDHVKYIPPTEDSGDLNELISAIIVGSDHMIVIGYSFADPKWVITERADGKSFQFIYDELEDEYQTYTRFTESVLELVS